MIDEQMTATLLRLLAVSTYRYYLATCVGNPAPAVKADYELMTHPRPGDWVMEITTAWFAQHDTDRIGRLVAIRDEVMPYEDEETATLNDHEELRDKITYIERMDGTLCRWHNCDFIRVFDSNSRRDETDEEIAANAAWVRDALARHKLAQEARP